MINRDAIVMIRAGTLQDLCVLALEAADTIATRGDNPPLESSLRGAVAEARVAAVEDPVG